ncbi:MAG: hypothetical protein LBP43_00075 [Treponema sp.]|jgi:hypothetical protein|nr:hypothetical protein [Treponema sp.]
MRSCSAVPLLLFLGCLFFVPSPGIAAWGKKDLPREEPKPNMAEPGPGNGADRGADSGAGTAVLPEEILQIRGRVRLVGNMPFSRLVISDEAERDWYLEGGDRELLAPYEQQTLTVIGRAEYQDIILANGQNAGLRRFLRNVRLLSAEESP